MKWTLKLVTEVVPGKPIEEEVATIERGDLVSPATVGLAIAEGKLILERLQRSVVTSQIHRHGASIKSCLQCGKAFRTKGYYQSAECLWQCPDAYSAVEGLSVHWLTRAHVLHPFHESQSHHTRAKIPHCQNGRVTTIRQGCRLSR
jgi:hypothetical protein